jgi:hypothetical protein
LSEDLSCAVRHGRREKRVRAGRNARIFFKKKKKEEERGAGGGMRGGRMREGGNEGMRE